MSATLPALEREIYTVSRLNRAVRDLLESGFPLIWLEGEVSNLARPASGHLYFSLKDARAQVRCALFRNRARGGVSQSLANGQQVLARARVGLYEPRGEYQLIVEHVESAGEGALRLAYEALRRRLEAEGLFDAGLKRTPPALPRRIGVVTSPTGAALRDVLSVLRRRFPALPVLLYPVPVQGEGAGAEIARVLALASTRGECDVLLLVRGGGSLEDLWAFNEEAVARAIRACAIPVVCGVGHETDVTIADFAADLRAPTPTAAAELASPDRAQWLTGLEGLARRLAAAQERQLSAWRRRLDGLALRLERQHPRRQLRDQAQRLDELHARLQRAQRLRLERLDARLAAVALRLRSRAPGPRLVRLEARRGELARRLEQAMGRHLERQEQRLAATVRALNAVSPLQTLGRGYAIVRRVEDGRVLRRAAGVEPGERVEALLGEGALLCEVRQVRQTR